MSKIKKVALSAVLAASAFAMMASSAAASDIAVCQFSGLAGALNPPIPAAAHDPGGPTTIETGTYHFGGTATCARGDTDPGQSGNSGRFDVNITSDGSYANQVCGTGTADGTDPTKTVVTSPDPRAEGPLQSVYHIAFTAGQGKMDITDFVLLGDPLSPAGKHGTGAGFVNITPTMGGDCAVNDVAFFQVTGSFHGSA